MTSVTNQLSTGLYHECPIAKDQFFSSVGFMSHPTSPSERYVVLVVKSSLVNALSSRKVSQYVQLNLRQFGAEAEYTDVSPPKSMAKVLSSVDFVKEAVCRVVLRDLEKVEHLFARKHKLGHFLEEEKTALRASLGNLKVGGPQVGSLKSSKLSDGLSAALCQQINYSASLIAARFADQKTRVQLLDASVVLLQSFPAASCEDLLRNLPICIAGKTINLMGDEHLRELFLLTQLYLGKESCLKKAVSVQLVGNQASLLRGLIRRGVEKGGV